MTAKVLVSLQSKPGIIKLSGVDVTQKIIEALCNVCTRSVLFAVRDAPKDASRIAAELDLSISTVYKSLSVLEYLALAEVDKFEISSEGKKIKMYRSRIGKVEITMNGQEPRLEIYPNTSSPKSASTQK